MKTIEFAIKMEQDGEKYYKKQAEANKDNGLNVVFLMLAKDEESHTRILQNKLNGISNKLVDNDTLPKARNVFDKIGDFKSGATENPKQLDLYRFALDIEKKSIKLYEELYTDATDKSEKELYKYLIKQEAAHFLILEELISLVSRPEEWVESAEFGTHEFGRDEEY